MKATQPPPFERVGRREGHAEGRAAGGGVNECSQQENEKEKNEAENGR